MSGPDRIWAGYAGGSRYWVFNNYDAKSLGLTTEYIRRDPAVLSALPEVQALIAGAYEAAARETASWFHKGEFDMFSEPIRALTPADAIAARDAMIAEAVAKEREACAKVAESASTPVFDDNWGPRECAAVMSAMGSIAAAIRKRGEG